MTADRQLAQARDWAVALENETARLNAELKKYVGKEPTRDEEMAYLSRCLDAVLAVCDQAEKQATRWENPLPVPEWVETVRKAVEGERPVPTGGRRIYLDGEGDPWIEYPVVPDDGTLYVLPLQESPVQAVEGAAVIAGTGSLREVGRAS